MAAKTAAQIATAATKAKVKKDKKRAAATANLVARNAVLKTSNKTTKRV